MNFQSSSMSLRRSIVSIRVRWLGEAKRATDSASTSEREKVELFHRFSPCYFES